MKKDVLNRLRNEAESLHEKIVSLGSYIDEHSDSISDDDYRLLTAQYTAMTTYLFILGIRIKKEKK